MDSTQNFQRILSIDYGHRRIGVAVSDPLKILAQPLPTINVQNARQVLTDIKKIIDDKNVSDIVVGMPFHMKGTKGETALAVDKFIQTLEFNFKLPVHKWDERLTSIVAEKTIRELGKSPSRNKEKIDQISAQLILQSFLDFGNREV